MKNILGLQKLATRSTLADAFADSTSSGNGCVCSTTSGSCSMGNNAAVPAGF